MLCPKCKGKESKLEVLKSGAACCRDCGYLNREGLIGAAGDWIADHERRLSFLEHSLLPIHLWRKDA